MKSKLAEDTVVFVLNIRWDDETMTREEVTKGLKRKLEDGVTVSSIGTFFEN